jgi:hypothetical protein
MMAKCSLQLGVLLPKYMRPARPIFEKSGNLVVRASLGRQIKIFLKDLEQDYQAWAREDPDRQTWV